MFQENEATCDFSEESITNISSKMYNLGGIIISRSRACKLAACPVQNFKGLPNRITFQPSKLQDLQDSVTQKNLLCINAFSIR